MANSLKRYGELQDELKRLREEIESLENSPEIKRDLEFKAEVEELLQQYDYTVTDLIRVLVPEESAGARTESKTRRRAQRPLQVYENPHTREVVKTRGGNQKTLKQWREAYGAEAVQSWRVG